MEAPERKKVASLPVWPWVSHLSVPGLSSPMYSKDQNNTYLLPIIVIIILKLAFFSLCMSVCICVNTVWHMCVGGCIQVGRHKPVSAGGGQRKSQVICSSTVSHWGWPCATTDKAPTPTPVLLPQIPLHWGYKYTQTIQLFMGVLRHRVTPLNMNSSYHKVFN